MFSSLRFLINLGLTLTFLEGVTGRYKCTSDGFIRLGNSCYLFSGEIASWQEAHFRCRDHDSQLAVLATQYEDTTVRSYLERSEFAQLGRWIGGMWVQDKWVWAAQGTEIENRASFTSTTIADLEENTEWMCLYMDPRHRYHWSNENCIRQQHYICESPLTKSPSSTENINSNATLLSTTSNPITESPDTITNNSNGDEATSTDDVEQL